MYNNYLTWKLVHSKTHEHAVRSRYNRALGEIISEYKATQRHQRKSDRK